MDFKAPNDCALSLKPLPFLKKEMAGLLWPNANILINRHKGEVMKSDIKRKFEAGQKSKPVGVL